MSLRPILFLCLMLLTACSGRGDNYGARYGLQDLALSPDGQMLAVRFIDRELKRQGLGLFDITSGHFTPIPNPGPDRSFNDPSFSPDGRQLAAVSGNQLVLIDVASLAVTQLTEGGQGFKEAPMFLPDGSGLLFVVSNPAHFKLLNLADGQVRDMLDPLIGFATIGRPFFGGPDRIIFSAAGPRIPDLYDAVAKFPDSRPATDSHIYGMKFGDLPELILNNLWAEGKRRSRWFTGEQGLQASRDARRIVFIDYAENPQGAENNVEQELFAIEDGVLRQLTHLHSALATPAISLDGRTVAFGCDSGHSMSHDLCLLDWDSGKVRKVGLLGQIRSAS